MVEDVSLARRKGFEPLRSLLLRNLLRSLIRFASLRSKNAAHFKVSGLESALEPRKKDSPTNVELSFFGTP